MEILSALLTLFAGNPPDFLHQWPVMRSFNTIRVVIMNKLLNSLFAGDLRRHDAHALPLKWNVRVFTMNMINNTQFARYGVIEIYYNDVVMGAIASQITSLTIVYSTVHSDADQRKHRSSSSLAFVWGIHRGPVNSPHKWPVTRKMFPFDDVIMFQCGFKTGAKFYPCRNRAVYNFVLNWSSLRWDSVVLKGQYYIRLIYHAWIWYERQKAKTLFTSWSHKRCPIPRP